VRTNANQPTQSIDVECFHLHCECGSGERKISPEDRAVGPQVAATTCGPCSRKGGEGMDEKSSWTRLAVTIAIDWRFVLAVVFLVLALLLR
jgi:hypothetical protein